MALAGQSLLGESPWLGLLIPFPLPRPHQQKQSHSHQDGTATHSRQAQEMECPASSPFHQEYLWQKLGLGGVEGLWAQDMGEVGLVDGDNQET